MVGEADVAYSTIIDTIFSHEINMMTEKHMFFRTQSYLMNFSDEKPTTYSNCEMSPV
jgi:hypothetical protein